MVTDEETDPKTRRSKQAAKYWPRRERLDAAIDHVNTEGEEGINFSAERQPERDVTPAGDEIIKEINDVLIAMDKTWEENLLPVCSQIFRRDIRDSSELTQAEAVKALGFLKKEGGSMNANPLMPGEKYGHLTVKEHSHMLRGRRMYLCLCVCGNSCHGPQISLKQLNGSCGCMTGKKLHSWPAQYPCLQDLERMKIAARTKTTKTSKNTVTVSAKVVDIRAIY